MTHTYVYMYVHNIMLDVAIVKHMYKVEVCNFCSHCAVF